MTTPNDKVFSVTSVADFGVESIYLDEQGWSHIAEGHRDLRNVVMTCIQETVQNPTEVYKSTYDHRRLLFFCSNVQTPRGRPMSAVVQLETKHGRVITATAKNKASGKKIWDSQSGLFATYDTRDDVLYLSQGDARTSYAADDDDEPRIWLRFHDDDDTPAGATVFDATKLWTTDRSKLVGKVAQFLNRDPGEIAGRIESILR